MTGKTKEMEVELTDRSGRVLRIDASNAACPDSLFIMGERGFCMEFDRETVRRVVKDLFGIYEPVEWGIERMFAELVA